MTSTTEREFAQHVNRHKRELHVHCYRMLGSFDEAEDLVQETFLRAWRHRDSFGGGPSAGFSNTPGGSGLTTTNR